MKRETCKKCGKQRDGSHASYCRACYNCYKREWYEANREREVQRVADYHRREQEKHNTYMRQYRSKNKETLLEKYKDYRKKNKDKVAVWDNNKRSKRRAAAKDSIGIKASEWREIKARYQNCCAYCKKPSSKLQVDHIVALARGGKHEPSNIAPACADCNNRKNARDEIDFRQRLGQLI